MMTKYTLKNPQIPLLLLMHEKGIYTWPPNEPLPDGIDENRQRHLEEKMLADSEVLTSVVGLAVYLSEDDAMVFGDRGMAVAREPQGRRITGQVSILGKRVSAFTSEIRVRLPEGGLANFSVLVLKTLPE